MPPSQMLLASRQLTLYRLPSYSLSPVIRPCVTAGSFSFPISLVRSRSIQHLPGPMKRKATGPAATPKAKRQREPEPDYCDAKPQRAEDGSIIWPASESAIESARQFLREWFVLFACTWLNDTGSIAESCQTAQPPSPRSLLCPTRTPTGSPLA